LKKGRQSPPEEASFRCQAGAIRSPFCLPYAQCQKSKARFGPYFAVSGEFVSVEQSQKNGSVRIAAAEPFFVLRGGNDASSSIIIISYPFHLPGGSATCTKYAICVSVAF